MPQILLRFIFAPHFVLEERVPDVFSHCRHCQNVTLGFLVASGADAIIEHDAVIPNRPESAGRELVQYGVDDGNCLLEQLRPSFVLVATPECVTTILRAEPTQPGHNGI